MKASIVMDTDTQGNHSSHSSQRSTPELEGVEKPAIAWLQKLGYTHLSGKVVGQQQAHKHLPPILTDVLTERLQAFNPWLSTLKFFFDRKVMYLNLALVSLLSLWLHGFAKPSSWQQEAS